MPLPVLGFKPLNAYRHIDVKPLSLFTSDIYSKMDKKYKGVDMTKKG